MGFSLLPITVIAAITIFLIKEALEKLRKHQEHQRQTIAIKLMLADEIEKNNYTLSVLQKTLSEIIEEYEACDISLINTPSGSLRIGLKKATRTSPYGGSWPIPNISRSIFNKIFVQLASLDIKLFNEAKDAYESISEVEHVRNSLIDNISEEKESRIDGFFVSFCEYGLDELTDSHLNLSKLYKSCTGNELEKTKLRAFV